MEKGLSQQLEMESSPFFCASNEPRTTADNKATI
jgi:hypothetical protein